METLPLFPYLQSDSAHTFLIQQQWKGQHLKKGRLFASPSIHGLLNIGGAFRCVIITRSEALAVGVVGHRGGPVGEDAQNADVLSEHVEGDHDVAVIADGVERRLVVEGVTWRVG